MHKRRDEEEEKKERRLEEMGAKIADVTHSERECM